MKYLLAFLISFNVYATHPPNEARDAVTKALTSELWTLDQTKLRQNLIVLDHPTARKQIIMDHDEITFFDFATGNLSRSDSLLHNQFFQTTLDTFGAPPSEIAGLLTDWVNQ